MDAALRKALLASARPKKRKPRKHPYAELAAKNPGVSPISGVAPPEHTRFKPGHNGGNTRRMAMLLNELVLEQYGGRSALDILKRLIKLGKDGDLDAIKEILNRLDGPLPTGKEGENGAANIVVIEHGSVHVPDPLPTEVQLIDGGETRTAH